MFELIGKMVLLAGLTYGGFLCGVVWANTTSKIDTSGLAGIIPILFCGAVSGVLTLAMSVYVIFYLLT